MRWLCSRFVLGVFAVVLPIAVAGLAVLFAGAFDVRATAQEPRVMIWAIHRTMISAAREGAADVPPEPALVPGQVAAGFALYDHNCVVCHGGPGVARADWVEGMNPSPPFLIDASHHWNARELNWIITNGIKMTGMPGWRRSMNPAQIWDLVAFLRAIPTIDAATYARFRRADQTPPVTHGTGGEPSD